MGVKALRHPDPQARQPDCQRLPLARVLGQDQSGRQASRLCLPAISRRKRQP